jgi:hypothetical protein
MPLHHGAVAQFIGAIGLDQFFKDPQRAIISLLFHLAV